MHPTEQPSTVAAVIAAYCPPESLVETVASLVEQLQYVVVVDDGSPEGAAGVLDRLSATGAIIIRQGKNSGIAAALNAGVRAAGEHWSPTFYLTLDQDSRVDGNYVEAALETFSSATAAGLDVGFICAASYSGHAVPLLPSHDAFTRAFDPMQSGFLIPHSTIQRVGFFDEGLFIDGVDSEYTMRTRAAGMQVLVGKGCDIEHALGQRNSGKLLGWRVKVRGKEISYNYHSPSRVYYICRNGAILTRRYLRQDLGWVVRRLLEESKAHLLRFAFSPGRGKLLRAAATGIIHGMRGRTGRIPDNLEQRLR